MNRCISMIIAGLLLSPVALTLASPHDFNWAPLISCDQDINGAARWRALGPIYESRRAVDGQKLQALRPLTTLVQDPADQRQEQDWLWPLLITKRHMNQRQWRLLALGLWRDYDVHDPQSRYSFWLLPIYFQGRDQHQQSYWAIFPLGGKISDLLVWDQVRFVLFPLYGQAQQGRVRSAAYLWPFFSTSTAPHIRRLFLFPWYGRSWRQDSFDKRFVLWPFWTSARYLYPRSQGYGWILFPLVGHVKLPAQESWMFLPPLTRFSKSAQLTQINCPWPIVQYSSGLIEKRYLWPLIGYKVIGTSRSGFLFWPIGISSRRLTEQGINQRYFVVPLLYSETQTRPAAPETAAGTTISARSFKIWPLFSYHRLEDRASLRLPSLCPGKDIPVIERNYAALWTLYTHSSCGPITEDELAWGLLQYRRSPAGLLRASLFPLFAMDREQAGAPLEWSFLKGLVARERAGDRRRMRLLYIFRW